MLSDDYHGPDAIDPMDAEWEVQQSDGQWVLWVGPQKPKAEYFRVDPVTGRPTYYGIRPVAPLPQK